MLLEKGKILMEIIKYNTLEQIKNYINDRYDGEDVQLFENHDYAPAFLGVSQDNKGIYDYEEMIKYLMQEYDDMDECAAASFIDFNDARPAKDSPIILYRGLWVQK